MNKWLILLVMAGALYHFFLRTPGDLERLSYVSGSQGGIETLTQSGGADFEVNHLVSPGQVTIVEFFTEACTACKQLSQHYRQFLPLRPDIVVKRVKMPDNWSEAWAARQFHLSIGATPFIHIYDINGELLAADVGRDGDGRETLYKWMNSELRKDHARRHNR